MYNHHLLTCSPDYFQISYQINPYMDPRGAQPDPHILAREYTALIAAHRQAGRTIETLPSIAGLPDMTFTANQALVRGSRAVLGNLPPERAPEIQHTRRWLEAHDFEVVDCPYLFSGQGDALPTGTGALIKGRGWRSDPRSDAFVADYLGYRILPVQTLSPEWYDIDLAIGILRPGLVAACLDALDPRSRELLRTSDELEVIPVSLAEAKKFALNLVSDGHTVIMPIGAPTLEATLRELGFKVIVLPITQLMLGGGGIRCTTLALDADQG